jgi:hypothetical protein
MPQDDVRELEMTHLFNLTVPKGRKRADIDAYLEIDGKVLPFELKSTTGKTISTVRDFGPDHIRKWRDGLHWLFGFYDDNTLLHCVYASPSDMEVWILKQEKYIAPDIALADGASSLVTSKMAVDLLGAKDVYSLDDARFIMKQQWKSEEYLRRQDVEGGYSIDAITDVLRERCRYVILRGATLNNPHIDKGFFDEFEIIDREHAGRLRELVRDYLRSASPTEDAIS